MMGDFTAVRTFAPAMARQKVKITVVQTAVKWPRLRPLAAVPSRTDG
jgi:hypothetical protein